MLTRRQQAITHQALHGWQCAWTIVGDWHTDDMRRSSRSSLPGGTFTDPDNGPAWLYRLNSHGLTTFDRDRTVVDAITWPEFYEHGEHLPRDVQQRLNDAINHHSQMNQRRAQLSYPNRRTDPDGWQRVDEAAKAIRPEEARCRADLDKAIDAALPLAHETGECTDLLGYAAELLF